MNNKYIAELSFEYSDGYFELPLTEIQLMAIFKVLGIKINTKDTTVQAYSESMLKRFLSTNYQANPLHYQLSENVQIIDETDE